MLLVHQGMVEDVFLDDLKERGVEVRRSSSFVGCSECETENGPGIKVEYRDLKKNRFREIASEYLVGCDGAHSAVRKAMSGANMVGEPGKSVWGVLDGELHHS